MLNDLALEIIALLGAVALVAGFIDAIAGGGGLLTIPALLAAGVPPVSALATSKVQSSVGTAAAAWSFWRAGRIDLKWLAWPLLATLIGAGLGALAVQAIDTQWLMVVLPLLLAGVALYFVCGPKAAEEDVKARLAPALYALVAGGIGFYDGFFGPGTGSFFALSLVTLMGMGLTRATAHTKVLNLTSNLVALVVFAVGGHTLWLVAGVMSVGQLVGGWLGSHVAMRFGQQLIRPLLAAVAIATTVKLLADPANPLRRLVESWIS